MRVIAGIARHIQLKTVPGLETRPTTDRIKETLFNMIQDKVPGAMVLDLFSGSGALGIEAVSRGAERAVFVESKIDALTCIRENLKATHFENKSEIFACDVNSALMSMNGRECFDIIFIDPPYKEGYEEKVLETLAESTIVQEDTLIIVEALLETSFDFIEEYGLCIEKEKIYKTNKHVFLRKKRSA